MSDEAREAAWAKFVRASDWSPSAGDGFDFGFDAGVAEGIRQAREAVVESIERSADYGPNYYPDDALSAIDALGEEQDR